MLSPTPRSKNCFNEGGFNNPPNKHRRCVIKYVIPLENWSGQNGCLFSSAEVGDYVVAELADGF